jgi:hypothetical protein
LGDIIGLPEKAMKTSNAKNRSWIVLLSFLLLLILFLIPSTSGDALERGAKIEENAFRPATMIFLGSSLILLAGWGLKKFRK